MFEVVQGEGGVVALPDEFLKGVEALCREKLFDAPASALDGEKYRGDHRLWLLYLVFGLFVGLFFTLMYALPYLRAMG